jgi:hypothetical protein
MTPQEAIKIIETAIAEVEWEYPMDYAVAFEAAIKVLELKSQLDEMDLTIETIKVMNEKRMPKKVIFMSDKSKVCGRCKQRVLRYQPYCEDCGQALDWGEVIT